MTSMQEICRLCMCRDDSMLSIFDEEAIAAKIIWVSQLKVFQGDPLPAQICKRCSLRLDSAYYFKEQCVSIDKTLREMVQHQCSTKTFQEDLRPSSAPISQVEAPAELLDLRDSQDLKQEVINVDDADDSDPRPAPKANKHKTRRPASLYKRKRTYPAKRFPCPICGKKFQFQYRVQRHLVVHSKKKRNKNVSQTQTQLDSSSNLHEEVDIKHELLDIKRPPGETTFQSSNLAGSHNIGRPTPTSDVGLRIPVFTPRSSDSGRTQPTLAKRKSTDAMPAGRTQPAQDKRKSTDAMPAGRTQPAQAKRKSTDTLPAGRTRPTQAKRKSTDAMPAQAKRKSTDAMPAQAKRKSTDTLPAGRTRPTQAKRKSPDAPLVFECPFCDKTFDDRTKAEDHIVGHLQSESDNGSPLQLDEFEPIILNPTPPKNREFACNKCGRSLQTKSALINHLRSHLTDQTYRCHLCPRWFSEDSNRGQHLKRTHGVQNPYRCGLCEGTFEDKKQLVLHMTAQHNGAESLRAVRGNLRGQEAACVAHDRAAQ